MFLGFIGFVGVSFLGSFLPGAALSTVKLILFVSTIFAVSKLHK